MTSRKKEKLFLGMYKQKELDAIRKRRDLREILPLWHQMGMASIGEPEQEEEKVFGPLKELILKKEKDQALQVLLQCYLAFFSPGFVPRKRDEEFQGIFSGESRIGSRNLFLRQGAWLIRSLFFQETAGVVSILPCLPRTFVCGRMIHLETQDRKAVFHMEWTKHKLRRLCIEAKQEMVDLVLDFPAEVKTYRMKSFWKDQGEVLFRGKSLCLQAGRKYFFDLFQK